MASSVNNIHHSTFDCIDDSTCVCLFNCMHVHHAAATVVMYLKTHSRVYVCAWTLLQKLEIKTASANRIRRKTTMSVANELGFDEGLIRRQKANALAVAAFTGLFVRKVKSRWAAASAAAAKSADDN